MGRRKVMLEDASAWVFNRMADVYDARPPYPSALVNAIVELAREAGGRVGDLGAGIGHLTLPLAASGCSVIAVEPARAMLAELERRTAASGLKVDARHATAEVLPIDSGTLDVVVIADALHFLDAELTGEQVARVLSPRGALCLVTCEFADTPFMNEVLRAMEQAAPRRPRDIRALIKQLSAVAGVPLSSERSFRDDTQVDHDTLTRILRSISYIGPAMNAERFHAFRERVFALSSAPTWSRSFTLRSGRR